MSGYVGLTPPRRQKPEAAGSSGAVQAFEMENDGPVVGPDAPIADSRMVQGTLRLHPGVAWNRLAGIENNMFNFGLIQHTEIPYPTIDRAIKYLRCSLSLRSLTLAPASQIHSGLRAHPEGAHRERAEREATS
jgi:hypothetical protein